MKLRAASLHHFVKAAILFGFAMYIVYLVKSDNILYYIAPRMTDYVKYSSIAFYAMAVYQVYQGISKLWGKKEAGDYGHDHTPSSFTLKNSVLYCLFVVPLLLGFLTPDAAMATSLAAKKGMTLDRAASMKKEALATEAKTVAYQPVQSASPAPTASPTVSPTVSPSATPGQSAEQSPAATPAVANKAENTDLDKLFPSDQFTGAYSDLAKKLYKKDLIKVPEKSYIETLTAIDLYMDPFVGKKVELSGFVYRQDDMSPKQFVLGRFAVQCCSADAFPMGIFVEYDNAGKLATDSWIKGSGTLTKITFNGNEIMALKLDKFESISAPVTKYVYPDINFGI